MPACNFESTNDVLVCKSTLGPLFYLGASMSRPIPHEIRIVRLVHTMECTTLVCIVGSMQQLRKFVWAHTPQHFLGLDRSTLVRLPGSRRLCAENCNPARTRLPGICTVACTLYCGQLGAKTKVNQFQDRSTRWVTAFCDHPNLGPAVWLIG